MNYLASVFGIGLINQMHNKEHVIGEVVLFHCVNFKAVRTLVKILFANAANEATGF